MIRVPLLRGHPGFPRPRRGLLLGRAIVALVAPLACDARGVRALFEELFPLGIWLAVACETHGEAHGEDETLLFPDLLAIEVVPREWDALVVAGGRGAVERVALDPFARELTKRFAAAGRMVTALGAGRRVLEAAHVDGVVEEDAERLAAALAVRCGFADTVEGVPQPA
jgi:putative intracellular protease/amidase